MTWQLLNLWLKDLGYDTATIASLSVMGLPYYTRFIFIPLLEYTHSITQWHKNHWLALMSLCSLLIGILAFSLSMLLNLYPLSALMLIGLGITLNIAGICFEKALSLYKIECRTEEERNSDIFHEKIGLKIGRLTAQAFALVLAWSSGWNVPYTLFASIFIVYGSVLALNQNIERYDYLPGQQQAWSFDQLCVLLNREWFFFLFIFFISLSDQVASYFLMLFLRDIGLNYLQIAQMAKISAIANISLGAWGAYQLSKSYDSHFLLLIASSTHLFSLVFIGWAPSLHWMWAVFFIKNLTLGSKIFLLNAFKNNYIARSDSSRSEKRLLLFLLGIVRSFGMSVCVLFGFFYDHVSGGMFFTLVALLSMPALLMFRSTALRTHTTAS